MTDERKPILTPYPGPRARTEPGRDRDFYRPKTNPHGIPIVLGPAPVVPLDEFDESTQPATGVVEGDALRRVRRGRDTPARVEHLEDRVDGLVESMGAVKGDVGEMRGEVRGLIKVVDSLTTAINNRVEVQHVKETRTIEVDSARQVAGVEVDAARQVDAIDSRKAKRETILKAIGYVLGGSGIAEIIHRLVS